MLKLHIKPLANPSLSLQYACLRYFRDPDLFIGFMDNFEEETTERNSGVHVSLGGTCEELFRCIADKCKFHIDCSYSQVANCLIRRYAFLKKADLR